jgi:uncharacterized protein (TIGR02246 family)
MATGNEEIAIRKLMDNMMDAWNRGDAKAFGTYSRADTMFTNVYGNRHVGREEFDRRHEELFRGVFGGTTLTMSLETLRVLAPNVAVVDVDFRISGCRKLPPGVTVDPDGAIATCLLMVLVNEHGNWSIAAYHNVAAR